MPNRMLKTAGTLIGIGMGGFVDGIVFHQIFQLHNMLSGKIYPDTLVRAEINMVWDGLFHALTWITTAIGISLLWQAGKHRETDWNGLVFGGTLIRGWGVFNLVEGLIDHHLLEIHHVVERLGLSLYDYGFLGSGIVFIIIGQALIHKANKSYTDPTISAPASHS